MYELILRGGSVVDGTGRPAFSADVAVAGGRIAAIGDLTGAEAARVVSAAGLVVSPGFIDLHTHSDVSLLINPRGESAVRQGVTTEVVGNCGHSAAPVRDPEAAKSVLLGPRNIDVEWRTFGEYLDRLGRAGLSMNVGALVGHGALRMAAMGFASRTATVGEVAVEKDLLARSLDEGAIGLSFGLEYAPGNNSDPSELVDLARVAAERGRLVTSHIRNRDYRYMAAVHEMLALAEATGASLELSHLTSKYGAKPGDQAAVQTELERAVERGVDVSADMLPYIWGMSSLPSAILPPWAFEGGLGKLRERLADPEARAKFKRYDNPLWKIISAGLWDRLIILSCQSYPQYVGRTVAEIAAEMGREAYDALFDIMLAEGDGMYGIAWAGRGVEDEVLEEALAHPLFMVASDGLTLAPYGALANVAWHPTSFGWAARTLAVYVREKHLFSLERAVQKMTSLPAKRLGLTDRGQVKAGFCADLAVFDPKTVTDWATVYEPKRYAEGVRYVLANGQLVIDEGEHTGRAPGVVLRR